MATKIIMPKQGLQMTEGTISQWLIAEGETCEEGKPLFEMETDKLTITMDSPATGTLLKIVHNVGDVVPITQIIGVIGEPGEDITGLLAEAEREMGVATLKTSDSENESAPAVPASSTLEKLPTASGTRKFSTPRARMRAEEKNINVADIPSSGPDNLVIERDVLRFEAPSSTKASPLARKMAELEGISVDEVTGTGSHGKIMKDDIVARVAARAVARQALSGENSARAKRVIPYAGARKIIGERMLESLRTEAQAQHVVQVDMTNAGELRKAYKKKNKKVSYNDIVMYATSRALVDYPMMNACITDEGIEMHDYVNLGMAVSVDNGLVVPNLKNADLMRLEEFGMLSRELADKARNNRLVPEEISGGTFTVSNLGMFGLDEFTAIINVPEAGILAVGAIKKTPVVIDDQIVIRPIMSITLSYDHRVNDGVPAAEFLTRVKEYIENPTLML